MRRTWVLYGLVPVIIAIDAVSKAWASGVFGGSLTVIPGWLKIWLVHNRGSVFGLGEMSFAGRWLPYLLPVVVVCLLAAVAWRTDRRHWMRHLGFACMIGGACGNLIDRALHGYVVDFLQFASLPVINVADLAIGVGVIVASIDVLRSSAREESD